MSGGQEEQNKTEDATPFKLAKAREKGSVARGIDLSFVTTLGAFLLFLAIAGTALGWKLLAMMQSNLSDFAGLSDPRFALKIASEDAAVGLSAVVLLGITLLVIVVAGEILQLRGLVFSAQPLKPDFSRLNPAKGLKRLFSMRMLKEAIKSIVKFIIYTIMTVLAVRYAIGKAGFEASGTSELASLFWSASLRLLALFAGAALVIAAIDQLIARREFAKQMRMSRSELTREFKEREGEPRIKSKRKQLHAELQKQVDGLTKLAGSDLVIVNPEHYAVALAYDAKTMNAPAVRAKGRNRHALAIRGEAARLGIPVVPDAPLARALFHEIGSGLEIGPGHYRAVALHYSSLRADQSNGTS